jgi:hypothetical protein
MKSSLHKKETQMKTLAEKIKQDWFNKVPYATMAKKYGTTVETIRKTGRKAGYPVYRINKQSATSKEDQLALFRKFLSKGRTEREMVAEFGNADMLKEKFEGLDLYRQRNAWNEPVFILIPKMKKLEVLKPKEWTYHVARSEDGVEEPYLMVQLPDFKGKITVVPLYDVHFGHHAHRSEKFLAYINWIASTPNVYAILGGDLMENALDDGRGMSYDQTENPQTQLDEMTKMLAPIAHRILVSVPGNHEARTEKRSGIDVTQVLAERLQVPYFCGPVFLDVLGNGYRWSFYVQHGNTFSRTKGGKMNAAARPKTFTGLVHFFVSGHVHDKNVGSETLLLQDPVNCRLIQVEQWFVVAQSFLGWYKTYAYRAGWQPPAPGGVAMELDENGSYRAVFSE